MDQESFRKLLQTPKAGSTNTSTPRGSLLAASTAKSKQKTVTDASQPAFKPRTIKKKLQGQPYRDRAAERRVGADNDYAQVEALAEDFERRNANNADKQAVEEQRRYLGGDSEHSVLVKGLDYALLEQNRAKLATSTAAEDDDSLEQAFLEVASSVSRKRTREEIVQELKAKRAKGDGAAGEAVSESMEKAAADASLDEAKKAGKFRPIGFKPIGGGAAEKEKKKAKKSEGGKAGKKKKRKVEADGEGKPSEPVLSEAGPLISAAEAAPAPAAPVLAQPEPEPELLNDDFDIFADAGDYTGVDLGDDDDDHASEGEVREETAEERLPPKGKWFATSEDEHESRNTSPPSKPAPAEQSPPPAGPPPDVTVSDAEEGEEEEERPIRLQPLASSAIPSIKDLLEMDSAASRGKRRSKKEKKDKEKGGDGEEGAGKVDKAKIDRDYQRLKAYTEKKVAAGRVKS